MYGAAEELSWLLMLHNFDIWLYLLSVLTACIVVAPTEPGSKAHMLGQLAMKACIADGN